MITDLDDRYKKEVEFLQQHSDLMHITKHDEVYIVSTNRWDEDPSVLVYTTYKQAHKQFEYMCNKYDTMPIEPIGEDLLYAVGYVVIRVYKIKLNMDVQ